MMTEIDNSQAFSYPETYSSSIEIFVDWDVPRVDYLTAFIFERNQGEIQIQREAVQSVQAGRASLLIPRSGQDVDLQLIIRGYTSEKERVATSHEYSIHTLVAGCEVFLESY